MATLNTSGSEGLTPISNVDIKRPTPSANTAPTATPTPDISRPCRTTSCSTERVSAPRAMRTPNSRKR